MMMARAWLETEMVARQRPLQKALINMTADEMRLAVLARAKVTALVALAEQASEAKAARRRLPSEHSSASLAKEVAWLRGGTVATEEARCETMARPGVVMGEQELQGLANVRSLCVQVGARSG